MEHISTPLDARKDPLKRIFSFFKEVIDNLPEDAKQRRLEILKSRSKFKRNRKKLDELFMEDK